MLARRALTLLSLNPGEGGTVALAVAMAFLGSGGMMIAQSSIDALFFARYGADRLPVLYVVVGVAMFVTTLAVGLALAKRGRRRTFVLILGGICVIALAARAAVETGAPWVYGALWLVYNIAESTQLLAVWGIAGLVANTREAKRFFPLIAAGGVSGVIVGGLATGPLASTFGSENLLVVWALMAAGAAGLGLRLTHTRTPGDSAITPGRAKRASALDGFREVRTSELLRWMSVGALLTSLLFSLLYLPFSAAAAERYPDPDELAGFFGLFFAVSMGTALVLSLFVTRRLLTRFGVPVVILVLPALYLAAFGVLTLAATFSTLTIFRFAQIAWRSGGAGSTWEALVNTISPERRDRARAFLSGVPTQLGTIGAGAIALAAQRAKEPRILYGAGTVGALLAIAAISRVRLAYPRALVQSLREGRPTIFGAASGPQPVVLQADAAAVAVLENLLRDRDPAIRRLAVYALGDVEGSAARTLLRRATRDPLDEVRASALESLERLAPGAAAESARTALHDASPGVRLAALSLLARCGLVPEEDLLDDRDGAVRTLAAAMLLGRAERSERVLRDAVGSEDAALRAAAMRALTIAPRAGGEATARRAVKDPQPAVRAEALRALAAIAGEGAIKRLVDALADHDAGVRLAAAEALGEIGVPAAGPVAGALLEGAVDGALAALERIPLNGAAGSLRQFASVAVAQALEDERLARDITATDPASNLLRDSLRSRAHSRAVSALRASALLGGRAEVAIAVDSLTMSDAAQRANALEVIETVGEPELVRPLLSLWEQGDRAGGGRVIRDLRYDPDDWIRICAEAATAASEGGTMKTLPTLALVERVIFLRKAPIFGALPPQDLQPIAAIAEEHVFSEGDTIVARGEPGDTLYVIVEGEVRVVGADEEEMAVRGSGDVIGEMAVIASRPRMASLIAKSDARVLELHKRAFEAILRERPDTALAMMRVLCERLAPEAAIGTN